MSQFNRHFLRSQIGVYRRPHAYYLGLGSKVRFPIPAVVVDEEDGTNQTPLVIERVGDLSEPATVTVRFEDISATNGQDYDGSPIVVPLPASQPFAVLFVQLLPDGNFEGTEAFRAILADPTGNVALGDPAESTVTLLDNDAPRFTVLNAVALEPATGTVTATFGVFNIGNTSLSVPVAVDFATADGSAIAGQDYEAAAGQLSFASGEFFKQIVVTINSDALSNEGPESFFLDISSPNIGVEFARARAVCNLGEDSPNNLLLDIFQASVAIAPYGLSRTLAGAKTADIRRASNGAIVEQRLAPNLLPDAAALLGDLAGSGGFLLRATDQTGNENDPTQNTTTQQVQVADGVDLVRASNGYAAWRFTGDRTLLIPKIIEPVTEFSIYGMVEAIEGNPRNFSGIFALGGRGQRNRVVLVERQNRYALNLGNRTFNIARYRTGIVKFAIDVSANQVNCVIEGAAAGSLTRPNQDFRSAAGLELVYGTNANRNRSVDTLLMAFVFIPRSTLASRNQILSLLDGNN